MEKIQFVGPTGELEPLENLAIKDSTKKTTKKKKNRKKIKNVK